MAYTPNVPQAADKINTTQDPILQNFINIPTLISANHVGFDGTANEGKHTYVTMQEQAAPAPGVLTDEVIMFSKESAYTGGKTVLSYKNEAGSVYDIGDGGTSWALLPCGLLMKWGLYSWISGSSQSAQYAIPHASSPLFSSGLFASFQVQDSPSSDTDAAIRFQRFLPTFAADQKIEYYVTKRTASTAPPTFQFYYLIFGIPA